MPPLFDVLVIGAGPSGALAAALISARGLSVLLLDKSAFPRDKVCGCCLSADALSALDECSLSGLVDALGGQRLTSLQLAAGKVLLGLPLFGMRALSRRALDMALVERAIASGAQFLAGSSARLIECGDDCWSCEIDSEGQKRSVSAKVVVAADGIAGTALKAVEETSAVVGSHSYIGVGTIAADVSSFFRTNTIYMACGAEGYAGLVRLEDGKADLAAALSPGCIRRHGGAAQAVRTLFDEKGWALPVDLESLTWRATVPLTRHRRSTGAKRLFVIGDAAGYVEPFTGEGIAWALRSAQYVAPLVVQAARNWHDSYIWRWQHTYRSSIAARQRTTRLVASILRYPFAVATAVDVLNRVPFLKEPLVRSICHPFAQGVAE